MIAINRICQGLIAAILFTATGVFAADTTNSVPDALLLRNGDRLEGSLVSIDPQHVLRWKHGDVAGPIEFKMDHVSEVEFHPLASPPRETNAPCRVSMVGGDAIEGEFVSCNHDALVLQTWFAGQLKIPRKLVTAISFLPTTPDVFMLTAPDGWIQGVAVGGVLGADSGQWTYRDGAYYADKAASLARDIKMPDSSDLQFDLSWTGSLSLSLALYTDSLQPILIAEKDNAPDFAGFYSMRFQSMFVDVARIKKNENPVVYLPAVVVPAFSQTNRVHIDVRSQRKTGTLALAVDGQVLQVWKDTNGVVGNGSGLRFVHNVTTAGAGGGKDLIKLSDLRLAPWDGILPSEPTNTAPTEGDVAWLTNTTTISGTVETMADGKLSMRDKKDHVEIPLGRLRRVTFSVADDAAKDSSASYQAFLDHGTRVTLQLDNWTAETVTVHSPEFGEAKFDPKVFRKLVIAPLDPPPNRSVPAP